MLVENLVLPKIESEAVSQKYGKFIVGPLARGYGTTIGNALRRVLLSSLPGAAVTSIRVSDVAHEFSAIPGVVEDMMQLILNIKQLRFKLHDAENARLWLKVHGAGTATAADLELPAELELINPDQYLFTVDAEDAFIEIEMMIEAGIGYSPAEERNRLPIGELPVDAIFSPIRRTAYRVEKTRVGQDADYDKVIMEVWTDGSIKPEEAISKSAQILVTHLMPLAGLTKEDLAPLPVEQEEEEDPSNEFYDTPIEELDLSVRVFNSLKRQGVKTVGEVLDILARGDDVIKAFRNFGEKSLDELKAQLQLKGFLPEEEA